MTRRIPLGFCGVAIAAAFLATGIEAKSPGCVFRSAATLGQHSSLLQCESVNQQTPAGGRGSAQLSSQVPRTTVPDLSGRTEQEARDLLAKARLRVGDITRVEANSKPGTVLKQDRAPGSQVAIGTPVAFALAIPVRPVESGATGRAASRGGAGRAQIPPVTVPDLSGRTEQEARDLLAKARLRVGEITKVEANSKPGTVLKQDRTPGSQVAPFTAVGFALVIPFAVDPGLTGPQTPPVTVPDLSGRTEQEARELLLRARLRVGDVSKVEASSKPGTVVKQDPAPRRRVAPDTLVAFTLAIPIPVDPGLPGRQTPPPVTVPDLSGRTDQEARELLARARLRVGDVSKVEASSKPGTVVKQDPAPRSLVTPGTLVAFALAIPIPVDPGLPGRQTLPVTVPDLSGRTEQEARELLANARLRVGDVSNVEASITSGTVLKQDPAPRSRVAPGTPVAFALAMPITVGVPDLSGRTEQEARDLLLKARLTVGEISRAEANVEPGTAFKQDRAPGSRVSIGTPVGFALAIPITVAVPDLSGRTEQEARDLLAKARLTIGDITRVEASVEPGTAFKQDRAPGSRVTIGTPVGFALATPITVAVPDLSGRTEAEARDLLAKGRLRAGDVTRVEANITAGTVLKQDRTAGSRVAVGTPVAFALAIPITVEVPQLVDRTQAEAIGLLKGAQLAPGAVTLEESRRPAGTVVRQRPAAGSRIAIGGVVEFAAATPVTVAVPQLVGRTQAEAMSLLKNLELASGDVGSEEARRPPGTVLSQQPAASTRVVIGTAVAIVTARPVTVLVPDIVSRSEADARKTLTDVELTAGTVSAEESRRPSGSIVRQSVATGTRVTIGTAVDLVIATPVTVLVPRLVGQNEESARQQLAGVELVAGTTQYEESATQRGVISQGINPDVRVAIGTLVNLVVAVAETVAVPSFVGLTIEQARRVLIESRLVAGSEQPRGTKVEPSGTVLAQSNVAGTRVAVGTPIGLTVAVPLLVSVPPVVGLTRDAADALIRDVELVVGTVVPRFSLQPGGTVLAQATAPGSQVPFGTSVAFDVARPRVVWMAPLSGLLVLAGLTLLVRPGKKFARMFRKEPPPNTHEVPPLTFTVRAHVDAGGADVQTEDAQPVRREVRIQPVLDGGFQEISVAAGDLIRSERRDRKDNASHPEEKP